MCHPPSLTTYQVRHQDLRLKGGGSCALFSTGEPTYLYEQSQYLHFLSSPAENGANSHLNSLIERSNSWYRQMIMTCRTLCPVQKRMLPRNVLRYLIRGPRCYKSRNLSVGVTQPVPQCNYYGLHEASLSAPSPPAILP